jgi:LETM1 and EF-hand domain-containing protein 1
MLAGMARRGVARRLLASNAQGTHGCPAPGLSTAAASRALAQQATWRRESWAARVEALPSAWPEAQFTPRLPGAPLQRRAASSSPVVASTTTSSGASSSCRRSPPGTATTQAQQTRHAGGVPSTAPCARGPGGSKADTLVARVTGASKKLVAKAGKKALEATKRLAKNTAKLLWAFIKDPRIIATWYKDIKDACVHFVKWVVTGFRLFGADVRASWFLTKRILMGYPMTVRERRLLVRTTSDCLKLIPFSLFLIIPFAELALPFALRLFPNMLPSTFFEQKYDNATLARKFKAKEEMAEFMQQVVMERTKEISKSTNADLADKAGELQDFQTKLMEGQEYPSLKEILRFSSIFKDEISLKKMSPSQLSSMSKMLGLPQAASWWPGHLEVQLRHHVTNLRREDRDLQWEGIDTLSDHEIIEACRKRAIRFHEVTKEEMQSDLNRWIQLSSHREIPTQLLLWIQTFYLKLPGQTEKEVAELQMKVDEPAAEEKENEEKEMFHDMAERRKAQLETAQNKLEALRAEVDEVLNQIQTAPEPNAGSEEVVLKRDAHGGLVETMGKSQASEKQEISVEQVIASQNDEEFDLDTIMEEKRQSRTEKERLTKTLALYRDVVDRQKNLLDHQLKFLLTMRDNKPCQNKDADVILLDQRVRVMEMVNTFQKDEEEIEMLLTAAEEREAEESDMGVSQPASSTDEPLVKPSTWTPGAASTSGTPVHLNV